MTIGSGVLRELLKGHSGEENHNLTFLQRRCKPSEIGGDESSPQCKTQFEFISAINILSV